MPEKVITARGKNLGGETPLICTPLVGRSRERILAEAASVVAKKPDVIEWRVDFFEGIGDTGAVLDVARALRTAAGELPIIFTRRSMKEGGESIAIGDEDVVRLYDAVGASRLVDFIDFEMGNDPEHVRRVRESTRAHETRLILSYHNFGYTPGRDFLVQRFLERLDRTAEAGGALSLGVTGQRETKGRAPARWKLVQKSLSVDQ